MSGLEVGALIALCLVVFLAVELYPSPMDRRIRARRKARERSAREVSRGE